MYDRWLSTLLVVPVIITGSPRQPRAARASAPPPRHTDCAGRSFSSLKAQFEELGYCIFTSCSLQSRGFLDTAAQYTRDAKGRPNGILRDSYIGARVARDAHTMALVHYLHDAPPLPFQSLQFYNGTQRRTHSDVVHFDTL